MGDLINQFGANSSNFAMDEALTDYNTTGDGQYAHDYGPEDVPNNGTSPQTEQAATDLLESLLSGTPLASILGGDTRTLNNMLADPASAGPQIVNALLGKYLSFKLWDLTAGDLVQAVMTVVQAVAPIVSALTETDPNEERQERYEAAKCAKNQAQFTESSLPSVVLLIAATTVILLLFFLQRRKNVWRNVAGGRPGLLKPFPIIDAGHFRLTYMIIWAMVAYDGLQIIFDRNNLFISVTCFDKWVKPLIVLCNVLIFAVLYFPIVAGMMTDSTLGYMVATGWVWGLSVRRATEIAEKLIDDDSTRLDFPTETALQVFQVAIPCICMLFLCISLPIHTGRGLYMFFAGKKNSMYSRLTKTPYYVDMAEYGYVKELFKKRVPQPPPTGIKKVLAKFMIYKNTKNFRYSTVFLSTIAVGFVFLYYITFVEIYGLVAGMTYLVPAGFVLVDDVTKPILQTEVFRKILNKTLLKNVSDYKPDYLEQKTDWIINVMRAHVNCFFYSNVAALILCFFIQVVLVLTLFIAYKNDRLRAMRGQYEVIRPPALFSGRGVIGGAVRYMGFQSVMFVWGYVIQLLLFTVAGVVIGAAIVIPLVYGYGGYIITFLLALLPAIAVSTGLSLVQQLMSAFLFTAVPCGREIVVNNQRGYSIYAYVCFFKNLFVGLVSALLRLILSLVFGAITFSRLDMPSLTPFFVRFDTGIKVYETFIHLEHAQQNPTMVTFTHLIQERISEQAEERRQLRAHLERERYRDKPGSSNGNVFVDTDDEEYKAIIEKDRIKRCKQFKWLMLKTLAMNPILGVERKMKLKLDQFAAKDSDKPKDSASDKKKKDDSKV